MTTWRRTGFQWIDANDGDHNVVAFQRIAPSSDRRVICVGNFSPVVLHGYRVGLPRPGWYQEILDTDAATYGGSNVGNMGGVKAEPFACHGQPCSALVTLPPLGYLWFLCPGEGEPDGK
ncbi:MAG TPA: alpha amylase C-terminal domain-containing protein [Polyangia bacterium]|nr:alpha amylase C-terminal domain-containing protein [Polyangia bacterium]